ncbi:MAG: hypothetical protein ACO20H_01205 [Bacteriovoracaceae bacterium]
MNLISPRAIFLIFVLLFSVSAHSKFSLRRCLLLPITDDVKGAVSFKVFQKLEFYLKNSKWCYYKSNSEILNILGAYQKNLKTHLANTEVLKVISDRTKAGSLIKVDLIPHVKGIEVEIWVIADNGRDLYFKEKTLLETNDIEIITRTIMNWLEIYSRTIPYDGRIVGVLGNQFTIDIGQEFGVYPENKVTIYRPKYKKKHPLLKEIVEWEKISIGDGKLFHVTSSQSHGKALNFHSKEKVRIGDWVLIEKEKLKKEADSIPFKPVDRDSFGKLGTLGLFLNIGKGSATSTQSSTDIRKINGLVGGIDLEGELWVTREFWSSLELGQHFGTFSADEGNIQSRGDNSVSNSLFKWKFGYKYLPIGFFYGPQVDGYFGYGRRKYGLDTQTNDGFVETTFAGFLLGVRGNMPIHRLFRIFLNLEFMPSPGYTEKIQVYGKADDTSYYQIRFGTDYVYAENMSIEGSYSTSSSSAEFGSTNKEVKYKESLFRVGAKFTF